MNAYMFNTKGSMMTGVSTFRLYLLRAGYLLLVVGLGSTIWPAILDNTTTWELQRSAPIAVWARIATSAEAAARSAGLISLRPATDVIDVGGHGFAQRASVP